LGIVDRAVGRAAPGILGSGIAVVDADEVDAVHVKVEALPVLDHSPKYEVKLARSAPASRSEPVRQPWLRTAPAAALAEAFASSVSPSIRLRMVFSPFSRLMPSSSRRCVPVSRAATKAARALLLTRFAVGR